MYAILLRLCQGKAASIGGEFIIDEKLVVHRERQLDILGLSFRLWGLLVPVMRRALAVRAGTGEE